MNLFGKSTSLQIPGATMSSSGLITADTLGFRNADLIRARYSPNIALAKAEGRKARRENGLKTAHELREANGGHLLILIDEELDFADDGRLAVPGTYDDVERLIRRIERLVLDQVLTDLIVTIDVHPPHTIHSDSWWEDENSNPPDVTIPVEMELVEPNDRLPFEAKVAGNPIGRFRPRIQRKYTVEEYAPYLKKSGQGNIWVFADHCRENTDGRDQIPALVECIEWASAALDLQPLYMYKGMIPETDWFGPFCPCMPRPKHPQGGLQTKYLEVIRRSRRTEVAGEAKDFCVKAGMLQISDYYGSDDDKAVRESIYFIDDCTSAIFPDDPDSGNTPNADFVADMESKGIQMITHDAPLK